MKSHREFKFSLKLYRGTYIIAPPLYDHWTDLGIFISGRGYSTTHYRSVDGVGSDEGLCSPSQVWDLGYRLIFC